ncbi:hypothetical protein OSG_eHP25_00010 [environmental Halophage eHP-25]|nr:hypothetical protein OSG_eHP25_00010 [environmental Halophage eHP-25]
MRRQEIMIAAFRNDVRAFMGGEPIEDPYGNGKAASNPTNKTEEDKKELDAFKYEVKEEGILDWDEDLTT